MKEKPASGDGDLGLDLRPGDHHYRAYVGPPKDFDLIAAMSFNLLTCLGLRQHHRILDVGCGSLRVGRMLIPYLNAGNYTGVEPNAWLLESGIAREVGRDLIEIKKPLLLVDDSLQKLDPQVKVDYVLAQSIFSHCSLEMIRKWLLDVGRHLSEHGLIVATFLEGIEDFEGEGWIYPGCVMYRATTMQALGEGLGFRTQLLTFRHPRQRWICYYQSRKFDELLSDGEVHWNKMMKWLA